MSDKVDLTKFDNPYVQVVWEDYAENFTQEKIKSVKHYFQQKYSTTNINVITKTKVSKETTHNVDISFNILDKNYQLTLVESFLKSKSNEGYYDKIYELDNQVDNKMIMNQTEVTPFKKWFIKNIEFSNFLSYGENQRLDFDKCNGISVVESNPPNFGGKTVLSVDLLFFLFFNETTKTTKAEEIFNRFTDKNKVSVKGEIVIDGDDYIIERNITRKLSKSGDWTVKTELDFFKKLADGSLQNFTGEQRRETEAFIKTSIGTKEDFLMTILTTATNLEELIDSKPTARGQVLSRFMGLDFLKRKEDSAKELYSEFSKSMISNVYNSESLKSDIQTYKDNIQLMTDENIKLQKDLIEELVRVQTEIKSIEKLQSSVSGGIICEHCGIDLMNASITQAKINELAGFITHKDQIEGLMQVLSGKEKGFVTLKKEFDEYEKNKLIKEKYELSIESFDLKIKGLKDKLQKYNDLQDKILANDKIETQLLKAGQRITELETEKLGVSRKIDSNIYQIETSEGKILDNLSKIEKIAEESEKEKIYKLYLEIYGKNGISKLIMKTMMPLINSELQRLLEDSSHFRLEVKINDKNEVEFVMVDNNTQVEKNIASGSGYERTIASLALRAVLSKICSLPKPNIIVFDEVFGKISNENLDMVSEFFTKIKEYFEKIFVITHNPMVTNWADNVVKVRKEENISYVSQ